VQVGVVTFRLGKLRHPVEEIHRGAPVLSYKLARDHLLVLAQRPQWEGADPRLHLVGCSSAWWHGHCSVGHAAAIGRACLGRELLSSTRVRHHCKKSRHSLERGGVLAPQQPPILHEASSAAVEPLPLSSCRPYRSDADAGGAAATTDEALIAPLATKLAAGRPVGGDRPPRARPIMMAGAGVGAAARRDRAATSTRRRLKGAVVAAEVRRRWLPRKYAGAARWLCAMLCDRGGAGSGAAPT
jgi:hypothetical protein